jgi:hypothetical protein
VNYYRDRSRAVIGEVLAEAQRTGLDERATQALLAARYPFPYANKHAYTQWRLELGLLVKPRKKSGTGGQGTLFGETFS